MTIPDTLKITFLGTGTSIGVPVPGCQCRVCSSADRKDKRLRTSLLLQWRGHSVIFDTGPDFRAQVLAADLTFLDALFFTHHHADHVMGLDDSRIFSSRAHPLRVYASEKTAENLRRIFPYAFKNDPDDYWVPTLDLRVAEGKKPIEFDGLNFIPYDAPHGSFRVLTWLVCLSSGRKLLAYATDVSGLSPEVVAAFSGVELLVLDMLRRRPHEKHLSLDEALELTSLIAPARTRFVHITHDLSHVELAALTPSDDILPASDREILEIPLE